MNNAVQKKKGNWFLSAIHSFYERQGNRNFTSGITSILLGLLFGFLMMLVIKPESAGEGFLSLFTYGFTKKSLIGNLIGAASPMVISGLAIAFAFKLNLFNIGITGQLTMGAFCSVITALYGGNWFLCMVVGALAGGVMGFLPGFLKAKFNVNEVLSGIMLNWVAYYSIGLMGGLIPQLQQFKYVRGPSYFTTVPKTGRLPDMGLSKILPGASAGVLVSLILVVIIYIILNKTVFGFELRMAGKNKYGARYAGANQTKSIILSLVISGALAGIAGYMLYANPYSPSMFKWDSTSNTLLASGFDGISVALVGQSNPIGCFFSAFFISLINLSSNNLNTISDGAYNIHYAELIRAVIIYLAALSSFISYRITKWHEAHDDDPKYTMFSNRYPKLGNNKEER